MKKWIDHLDSLGYPVGWSMGPDYIGSGTKNPFFIKIPIHVVAQ